MHQNPKNYIKLTHFSLVSKVSCFYSSFLKVEQSIMWAYCCVWSGILMETYQLYENTIKYSSEAKQPIYLVRFIIKAIWYFSLIKSKYLVDDNVTTLVSSAASDDYFELVKILNDLTYCFMYNNFHIYPSLRCSNLFFESNRKTISDTK